VTPQDDGGVEISWPLLPGSQFKNCLVLGLLTLPIFGFGLYLLYFALRYRHARVRVSLTQSALRFQRPGTLLDRVDLSAGRDDVEQVETFQSRLAVSLWATTEAGRWQWVGSAGVGHVLPPPDVRWVGEALGAWKAGLLQWREAKESERVEPAKKAPRRSKDTA
jgi:hypothetical protein